MTRPATTDGRVGVAGGEIAYRSIGSGDRTLVYLHGLLMDSRMNEALATSLAERDIRVVLVDLLGHGRSDRPLRASAHRMDAYGREVVAVLDHLGVERAAVGGISLGANVSLQVAVHAPDRVQAMVLEMPVLEWAVPAAALLFTPLLLTMHYAARPAAALTGLVARLPGTRNGSLDSVVGLLGNSPEVVKAVLHGILTGPVAPTLEERQAMAAPTLVIAHSRDLIHPFSDAENLVQAMPDARLLSARSMLELRLTPDRLTAEIADFLTDAFARTETDPISR